MKANNEYVIIEIHAARAGEEMKTDSGIVLGKRQTGEIPEVGTIVGVGNGIENPDIVVGATVPLTNGKMSNVPDPRVAAGESIEEKDRRQLAVTHWKNITVIY